MITAARGALSPSEARALHDDGFVVIDGPVPAERLPRLIDAYDRAMREATAPDLSVGRTTTRVHGLLHRGDEFGELCLHPPILDACRRTIARPFMLSTLAGRSLHPRSGPPDLHVDFAADGQGWPMVGFIFMVDEFRKDNGATRFLPGSHRTPSGPFDAAAVEGRLVTACGPPGSVIVYNGSILHGHGRNETGRLRRSIQGAFIRSDATSIAITS